MLASGGVAAQSALAISYSAFAAVTAEHDSAQTDVSYGSVPYSGSRAGGLKLAER